MEQQSARLRNTGFLTFFFSGICAISAGVVVSLLPVSYTHLDVYKRQAACRLLLQLRQLLVRLPGKAPCYPDDESGKGVLPW